MPVSFRPLPALAGLLLSLAACQSSTTETKEAGTATTGPALKEGPWRGELQAQGQLIPFLFEVKTEAGKPVVYLINKGLNGEERLRCDEISTAGDSTTIKLHVFDAALVVRADGADQLKGVWVKYDAKTPYRVPLTATAGERPLFSGVFPGSNPEEVAPFAGTWKVNFRDEQGKSYLAVGVFEQKGREVTGTFLTETGDYRYLSGQALSGDLRLSTFDGNHAFLFKGQRHGLTKITPPTDTATGLTKALPKDMYAPGISGHFYSGKSGHETWTAVLDPKAKLPDADTLTYLKKGESRLNFKFPSIFEGGVVEPTGPKYKGKVVVVQLLGSWCPNCMDETAFLAPWYEKNKARGVEVIGLGYERSPDYKKAAERLHKLRERYNIGYELAVAGVANKDSAAKSLPQLAKVLAFPTTIFLDKKGAVRSIHTGFSGPGTGKYYDEEIAAFNRTVDKLLKE